MTKPPFTCPFSRAAVKVVIIFIIYMNIMVYDTHVMYFVPLTIVKDSLNPTEPSKTTCVWVL